MSNTTRWQVKQFDEYHENAFKYSSGFQYKYVNRPPLNCDYLTSELSNEVIHIHSKDISKIVFHSHPWCGSVFVDINGKRLIFDLYEEEHGFKELNIESNNYEHNEIIITTGAPPNPLAKANQVWVAAIDLSKQENCKSLSRPVSPFCTLTNGKYGTFLTLTNDTTIGSSISQHGVWAPNDVDLFKSYIKEGMTVLDIGANIGHHSIVYSKLVGTTGRVIAFEPQSSIFRLFCANAVLNGVDNLDIINSCVGESEGNVHLYPISYKTPNNFGALGIDPLSNTKTSKGEKCRIARVDDLIKELDKPVNRVDFIKIDVQSFELFVLKGAKQTISEHKPILFLEIAPYWMKKNYDYKDIYYFLWSLDYEIIHPSDKSIAADQIKEWSGRNTEEWDIIAVPK